MAENNIRKGLGYIWTLENEGMVISQEALNERFGIEAADKLLEDMISSCFIVIDNQCIILTEAGRKQSELIIRRHRLAERLFFDVFDSNIDEYESGACKFELYVDCEIAADICTLLGHPETCPHGKIIPKGTCCVEAKKYLASLMSPLSGLKPGVLCKVVHIDTLVDSPSEKIAGFGILPGTRLRVHQIDPAFVIQIGESNTTIGRDIADRIYVRHKQDQTITDARA